METVFKIFCVIFSITLALARPQDLLGEGDDYQYGLDLYKLEDELINQAAAVDDKIFLQHLLSKWKTSTTTTEYPMEESSTETTTTAPETTTTTEATTTTTTTEETTTSTAAQPTTIAEDLPIKPNHLQSNVKPNTIPLALYPAPVYPPPSYSYYPISHYNLPPQIPQHLPAMSTHFVGAPQTMSGLHAVPHMPAMISQLPQTMFGMSGLSPLQAYRPYSQYPMQFISPVYSPYRNFKK
ncbi:hypothetical protein FF38_00463 [Lucilia cuprina]|uniref:Uncharacterized protein n=1 Tax=Lucilia cuprina TaxID=7375 RepID=A0A0L0CHV5_LUCCU|nr:hypothetical protein FF38_00463 [Lucilia cuprina]